MIDAFLTYAQHDRGRSPNTIARYRVTLTTLAQTCDPATANCTNTCTYTCTDTSTKWRWRRRWRKRLCSSNSRSCDSTCRGC